MKSIQAKREALGATQQAMASALGVDRSTGTKWEADGTYPRPRFLPMIAAFLGCTIDDLYADEPKRRRSNAQETRRSECAGCTSAA